MIRHIYEQWVYKIYDLICVLDFHRHIYNILTERGMEKPFYRGNILFTRCPLREHYGGKAALQQGCKLIEKIYMNTSVITLKFKKNNFQLLIAILVK